MPDQLVVRIEQIDKTVEGHIFIGSLKFNGVVIWGPKSCHDNVVKLNDAIRQGDPRFEFQLDKKDKTVEGHTRGITVEVNGKVILDKLSVHDNMDEMVKQIKIMQQVNPAT